MLPSPAKADVEKPRQIGRIDLKDLAALLIRREGLHEGLYEISIEFDITVANFTTPSGRTSPGLLSTVAAVALVQPSGQTPGAVDAAVVNPATTLPTSRKRAPKAKG